MRINSPIELNTILTFLLQKRVLLFYALVLISCHFLQSQNVSINNDGASPDSSAVLDISSNTKGILIPRMTEAQKNAINNPANGLLIFQSDNIPGFRWYNELGWNSLVDGENWSINGNAGTTVDTNFIGTTNNRNLQIKVKDTTVLTVRTNGKVGIGSISPNADLTIVDSSGSVGITQETFTNNASRIEMSNNLRAWRLVDNWINGQFKIKDQTGIANPFVIDSLGNTGIGTTSPNTTIDLNGSFSRRIGTLDIGDVSSIHNIDIDSLNSVIRLIGPASSGTSITGIVPKAIGQIITIINMSSQNLTFEHDDAGSISTNRFYLPGSSSKTITQYESITYIYNRFDGHWVVKN